MHSGLRDRSPFEEPRVYPNPTGELSKEVGLPYLVLMNRLEPFIPWWLENRDVGFQIGPWPILPVAWAAITIIFVGTSFEALH